MHSLCETCMFYEEDDTTCRVNPPVALMREREVFSVFPNVNAKEDWCGDHVEAEGAPTDAN